MLLLGGKSWLGKERSHYLYWYLAFATLPWKRETHSLANCEGNQDNQKPSYNFADQETQFNYNLKTCIGYSKHHISAVLL